MSVLDPEALYIVKNTGTMVIGVSKNLESVDDEEKIKMALSTESSDQEIITNH